jgi:hypothetical protein
MTSWHSLDRGTRDVVSAAFVGWFTMVGAFVYWGYLDRVSPRQPVDQHTVQLSNHGDLFYVTPVQHSVQQALVFAGAIVFIVCSYVAHRKGRR